MAHMSLHYLYNQKIIFLHMDVKERTTLPLWKEWTIPVTVLDSVKTRFHEPAFQVPPSYLKFES
jgi:hypothetical protein